MSVFHVKHRVLEVYSAVGETHLYQWWESEECVIYPAFTYV